MCACFDCRILHRTLADPGTLWLIGAKPVSPEGLVFCEAYYESFSRADADSRIALGAQHTYSRLSVRASGACPARCLVYALDRVSRCNPQRHLAVAKATDTAPHEVYQVAQGANSTALKPLSRQSRQAARVDAVTHVFSAAYPKRSTWGEPVEPNLTMLRNVIETIEPVAKEPQHVSVTQGYKV
jgi:hypothetical protein